MPELYHIPVEPNFEPRFDAFYGAILPVQSDKSYPMIHLGSCLIVVGNIEHNALLRLQEAEYSKTMISNEIKDQLRCRNILFANTANETLGATELPPSRVSVHLGNSGNSGAWSRGTRD